MRRAGIRLLACVAATASFDTSALAHHETGGRQWPPAQLRCGPGLKPFARLELLFGASRKDGPPVGEEEWLVFLAKEVTPRFPDGLTYLSGYGQWRNPAGEPAKETSRLLLILHTPAADTERRIEAIRQAYKTRFGQESVLRIDSVACVGF